MKAVNEENGFVEITLRATAYQHLRGVLRRCANGDDSADDGVWLERFLADLDRRDAEDIGTN
jgi:hypothetical protein